MSDFGRGTSDHYTKLQVEGSIKGVATIIATVEGITSP